MPLRRSPPQRRSPTKSGPVTSIVTVDSVQLQDSGTPPERSDSGNITRRQKRRREHDDELKDLRMEIKEQFNILNNSIETRFSEIKQQNVELQSSVQFLSEKYDTVLDKLQSLEKENSEEKKLIYIMEQKIEALESKLKSTGLEIRNVPNISNDGKKKKLKKN